MKSAAALPSPPRLDRRIALALGVVATAVLLLASRTEGFTRDEGYYFDAGEMYWQWYAEAAEGLLHGKVDAFRQPGVDHWWSYNHEHPPLMKALFGLSWRLLHRCDCPSQGGRHPVGYATRHRTLGLLSESEALRLPTCLFGGILVALVYLFALQTVSRRAALVAALLALCQPRYFFHAELACFDAPMATTWLLTIYCYWRSLTDRRFAVWTGVAFGLALATKLNGFFLPFAMLAHYLFVHRSTLARLRLPPLPAAFGWMILLGPLVVLGLWPWMWFHTVARVQEYLAFHLQHVHYNFEYLGTNYNNPPYPRSYAYVMTLLTAPVTTLVLAACGVFAMLFPDDGGAGEPARVETPLAPALPLGPPGFQLAVVGIVERPERPLGVDYSFGAPARDLDTAVLLLWLVNALLAPSVIAFTGAPIFGETKHWLTAMPFVALLAGAGADGLCRLLASSLALVGRGQQLVGVALCALLCAPAVLETERAHPYALTHYNLLAGGPPGGADLGMNRQFWGYASRGVLPWINQHVPRNGNVYWHDANQPMLNMDVREHLLRDDILNSGMEEAGVKGSTTGMVIHERHFAKYDYWFWDFYGTARPAYVLTDEGVPIVTVYQRPAR